MLAIPTEQPDGAPDDFECVVLEVKSRAPGFYTAAWRTFYVDHAGAVYLLRAPGQRAALVAVDDLPPGADPDPAARRDRVLRHLAAAVESLACRADTGEGSS
jgi:hypothetical protein